MPRSRSENLTCFNFTTVEELCTVVSSYSDPADINHHHSRTKQSPLESAIRRGLGKAIIEKMLELGARVDYQGRHNLFPVHVAVEMGDMEILGVLVAEAGGLSTLWAKTPFDETILQIAERLHPEDQALINEINSLMDEAQRSQKNAKPEEPTSEQELAKAVDAILFIYGAVSFDYLELSKEISRFFTWLSRVEKVRSLAVASYISKDAALALHEFTKAADYPWQPEGGEEDSCWLREMGELILDDFIYPIFVNQKSLSTDDAAFLRASWMETGLYKAARDKYANSVVHGESVSTSKDAEASLARSAGPAFFAEGAASVVAPLQLVPFTL